MRDNQLEELVPSVELCKKIPEGLFTDSALVWEGEGTAIWRRGSKCYTHQVKCGTVMFPAPTLREIMDQLAKMELCPELRAIITVKGEFIYTLRAGLKTFCQQKDESVEDMVMRAWLESKKESKNKEDK